MLTINFYQKMAPSTGNLNMGTEFHFLLLNLLKSKDFLNHTRFHKYTHQNIKKLII